MKTKDIASKYSIDQKDFDKFLFDTNQEYSTGAWSGDKSIKDDKIEIIVQRYKDYMIDKTKVEEQKLVTAKQKADWEIERAKALPKMLITSGFSFEGYRIVKYSGYISGDDAIQIDRGTASFWDGSGATNVGEKLMQSLTIIRRNALRELKEAAYDLGCNAVIGVDFDYLTLDPQTATSTGGTVYQPYVFGVTANGNAVIIEKIEDDEA